MAAVPEAVRAALAAPGTEQVPVPRRSLQIVGAGHASITAKEGALKVREGARVLAEGHDAEFFLHGTAVPLTGDDHLVAITSGDEDGLVEGIAKAADVCRARGHQGGRDLHPAAGPRADPADGAAAAPRVRGSPTSAGRTPTP